MTLKQYKTNKEIEGQNVKGNSIQLCKSTQEFLKKQIADQQNTVYFEKCFYFLVCLINT